jgi:hypothetical protein
MGPSDHNGIRALSIGSSIADKHPEAGTSGEILRSGARGPDSQRIIQGSFGK